MRKQVVGFQHVYEAIKECLHVLPLTQKFVVEGPGLGKVIAVCPCMQPILFTLLHQTQPQVRDGISFRDIQGMQDKADLSFVSLSIPFSREGSSRACDSEQDRTQRAFDLAQAVTDQVGRRLKRRIGIHDPAGVLIKGGRARSNTGQPCVQTIPLFSVQRRGSIRSDQRLFFSLSTSHSLVRSGKRMCRKGSTVLGCQGCKTASVLRRHKKRTSTTGPATLCKHRRPPCLLPGLTRCTLLPS